MKRRLRSLAWGELTAAAVFAGVAAFAAAPRFAHASSVISLWVALAPLLAILLQGSAFWFLRARGPLSRTTASVFAVARAADPVVLVAAAAVLVIAPPTDASAVVLCVLAWTFGVIEYLNYFVVRLSYPLTVWANEVLRWRKPRLVRDMHHALM